MKAGCCESVVNVRLVFTLGSEEPCCEAECDYYCESDEWCVAVYVSYPLNMLGRRIPVGHCVCEGVLLLLKLDSKVHVDRTVTCIALLDRIGPRRSRARASEDYGA